MRELSINSSKSKEEKTFLLHGTDLGTNSVVTNTIGITFMKTAGTAKYRVSCLLMKNRMKYKITEQSLSCQKQFLN